MFSGRASARPAEAFGGGGRATIVRLVAPLMAFGASLLIALLLLIAPVLARIFVIAAGPPVFRALLELLRRARGNAFRFRRVPQPAAREPAEHDVGVLALQLTEGRQQLVLLARAERGRFAVDENRPVREAGWHPLLF